MIKEKMDFSDGESGFDDEEMEGNGEEVDNEHMLQRQCSVLEYKEVYYDQLTS